MLLFLLTVNCRAQKDSIRVENIEPLASTNQQVPPEMITAEIEKLSKILQDFPKNVEKYRDRAMLYLIQQEFEKALADFEKVITLNNGNLAEAYFYKGLTSLALHNLDCESFVKAKILGYIADWEKYRQVCNQL